MQKAMPFLVIFAFALLLESTSEVDAQTFQWELLTDAEAAQVVRNFEGDPDLQFEEIALADRTYVHAKPQNYAQTMVWQLRTASREYEVSLYSRKVFSWNDRQFRENKEAFYGQPYDEDFLASQTLPVEQMEAIARDYAAAHNANYSSFNKVIRGNFWSNNFMDDRTFLFLRVLPNGAIDPSSCGVSVDTVKGRVIGYAEVTFPILVSTTPPLTAEQATQTALNALMPAGGNLVEGHTPWMQVLRPDILGVERLVWCVKIEGWVRDPETGEDTDGTLLAVVDAHNGQIFDVEQMLAAGSPKVRPRPVKHAPPKPPQKPPQVIINNRPAQLSYAPIVKGDTVLLYVGYVRSQGATVNVLSQRTLEASVGKRRVQLTVGSRKVMTEKGQQIVKIAPIEVKGRVYIPMELFANLTGFQVQYDRQHNTLKLSKGSTVPPIPAEQPIAVKKMASSEMTRVGIV